MTAPVQVAINDQPLSPWAEPPIMESGEPLVLHLMADQGLCGSLMIFQTALYQGYSEPQQPIPPLMLLEQTLQLQAGIPWITDLAEVTGPGEYQLHWQGENLGSFLVVD